MLTKQSSPMKSLTAFCKTHAISLVYLFGSQAAAGHAYLEGDSVKSIHGSDLDIGIVFDKLPDTPMHAYGEIYAGLAEIFPSFSIDPVFLQETNYLFQFEAIKGKIVFAVSELAQDAYEERVMKFASDISFHLPLFHKEVMEALEYGYFQVE
jgi:predicted nucleotidyltransferase